MDRALGYSKTVVLEEEYLAKAIVRKWVESGEGNLKGADNALWKKGTISITCIA